MTSLDLARSAYRSSMAPIRTPRASEYEIIARLTSRIRAASAGGRKRFPDLAAAIHDNRALWTLLAAEVASPENALGPELRARIFYLAEFTAQHSGRVLRGEASADVLIDINTAVMRGLREGAVSE